RRRVTSGCAARQRASAYRCSPPMPRAWPSAASARCWTRSPAFATTPHSTARGACSPTTASAISGRRGRWSASSLIARRRWPTQASSPSVSPSRSSTWAIASPTIPCRRARRPSASCAISPRRAGACATPGTARSPSARASRSRASWISLPGSTSPAISSSCGTSWRKCAARTTCRRENILVRGRGSAASSAVCYALGITAVDPVGMELLFERFLSEERGEWPDIDLDLPSGERSERVIQYVYEKYGKSGAAMTANVITYRGRSAVREVGKVLGFDDDALDRFSGLYANGDFPETLELQDQLAMAGIAAKHPRAEAMVRLYHQVHGLPRHLGQHSGGMVICQG